MFTSLYTAFALQSHVTWAKKRNRGAPRVGVSRIQRRGVVSRIFTLVRRAAETTSREPLARKSKREVVEQLQLWAALESMAARLAASSASDAQIAGLRRILEELRSSPPSRVRTSTRPSRYAFTRRWLPRAARSRSRSRHGGF